MATQGTASRRARAVLRLFDRTSGWQVEDVVFKTSSRCMLGGQPWQVERSIHANNWGTASHVSFCPKPSLPEERTRRLVTEAWPALRQAFEAAGFEATIEPQEGSEFGLFSRRLDLVAEVAAEWRFLHDLRPARAAALPARARKRALRGRERPGVADRRFKALRKDRVLMSHLHMLRIARRTRDRVAGQTWSGSLSIGGDPLCLQTIIHYRRGNKWPERSVRALDVLARISDPLIARGYRELDDGCFGRAPIGPADIARERDYLNRLTLARLLVPGVALPPGEGLRRRDRAFYDLLGPERTDLPCRRTGCSRGAVTQSVLCRVHHCELFRERRWPVDD
jgi:hypothetical protein